MPSKAFTLIELLIVVAIIAILAAIAVPNFLEAQTRSKVSRVKSDHRTIATAMESYLVDNNWYPGDSDNTLLDRLANGGTQFGLVYLTTPVAYMSTIAEDPFQAQIRNNSAPGVDGAKYYEVGSGSDNGVRWVWRNGAVSNPSSPLWFRVNSWIISSVGPDQEDNVSGNDNWPGASNGNPGFAIRILTYDPTNGTISDGDVVRAGGALKVGSYIVNDKFFGEIN